MTSHSETLSTSGSSNSEEGTGHERNSPDSSIWARLLYIILFVLIFGVVETLVWLITIVCFLFAAFKSEAPQGAVNFGDLLATYSAQIIRFLTTNENNPPWPFAKWTNG